MRRRLRWLKGLAYAFPMRPSWLLAALPLLSIACVWGRSGYVRPEDNVDGGSESEPSPLEDGGVAKPDVVVPDDGVPKRVVFVTADGAEGSHPSGIAHYDGVCTENAASAEGPAKGKKFKAWLSTKQEGAVKHVLADGFKGRFVLVTGEIVAQSTDDLTHNKLPKPITVDAAGNPVLDSGRVWTGTKGDGTLDNPDCGDWTEIDAKGWVGKPTGGPAGEWTHFEQIDCSKTALLYCFEVP